MDRKVRVEDGKVSQYRVYMRRADICGPYSLVMAICAYVFCPLFTSRPTLSMC